MSGCSNGGRSACCSRFTLLLQKLAALVREGALSVGADVVDCGVLTTPQLHHIVRMKNKGKAEWASEKGYFKMLADAYRDILEVRHALCSGRDLYTPRCF